MGNSQSSSKKINFEDIQYIIQNHDNHILINTLGENEQECLIKNTINYKNEESIINNFIKTNNKQIKF